MRHKVQFHKIKKPIISHEGYTKFDPFVFTDEFGVTIFYSNKDLNSIEKAFSRDYIHFENFQTVLKSDSKLLYNRCSYLANKSQLLYFTIQSCSDGTSHIAVSTMDEQNHFKLYSVVLEPEYSYEKKSIMNPFVLFEDNIYKMWYACGDFYEPNSIAYAESKDGVNFVKCKEPVLVASNHWYDKDRVGGCCVLNYKSGYLMFYIGYKNIDTGNICMAFSYDGIYWKRYKHNPVLTKSLFGWDSDSVYKPAVIIEGDRCYLYYNGRKKCKETIGLAICKRFVLNKNDF